MPLCFVMFPQYDINVKKSLGLSSSIRDRAYTCLSSWINYYDIASKYNTYQSDVKLKKPWLAHYY